MAGRVGASLLARMLRSLCGSRGHCCHKNRKKEVKRWRKCLRVLCGCCCCYSKTGVPDEMDAVEKNLAYKDKSTSYNVLCCSTNVRTSEFDFDLEVYRNSRYGMLVGNPVKRETYV